MSHNKINALVIDGSKMERHHASIILRHIGANCDHAWNSYKAAALTELNEYDVVFVSDHIPGEDPADIVDILLALPSVKEKAIPIIEMGNRFRAEKRLEGCSEFIEKPLKEDSIRKLLIDVLAAEKSALVECHTDSWETTFDSNTIMSYDDGDDFNTSVGMKRCGTMESYMSAIKIFYDTTLYKADEIEDFWQKDDIGNYTIKVHALKSSAGVIGAINLSEKARLLEEAGKKKDVDYINENTSSLLEDYRAFRNRFEEMFESKSDEDKPMIPDEVLVDAFNSIREFAENMDFDLTKMVIDSLEEYSLKDADKDKLNKINNYLLELDWDSILDVING
ncbi:MAG: hypothetical protein K6F00_07785 [Lachnospiraceae bacterium]|nr:hypothetical protein [Lachnospiraceae bacterium]